MAVFFGCLHYTLEEGPRWDWFGDATIRGTAWVSGIAGVAFVWRSLTHSQPVVDLRAFKSRNFALGCFFSFVTGIGIFATIYLTPLFLGRVRGFSALQIGFAGFLDRRVSGSCYPILYPLHPVHRSALANDVWRGLLRAGDVELLADQL